MFPYGYKPPLGKENMKNSKEITDSKVHLEEIENFILEAGSDDLNTFGGKFEGGINLQQVPDEIAPCILAILESGQEIKSYLEVGVAAGGLTFLIDHFFKPENIVLVDDGNHHKAKYRADILKGIKYQEVVGNSNNVQVIKSAKGFYDLITLDADLSYEGLCDQVLNYAPMLKESGFLIFHDSVYSQDVAKFVLELRECLTWSNKKMLQIQDSEEIGNLEFINEYVSAKHKPLGVELFRKVD